MTKVELQRVTEEVNAKKWGDAKEKERKAREKRQRLVTEMEARCREVMLWRAKQGCYWAEVTLPDEEVYEELASLLTEYDPRLYRSEVGSVIFLQWR